MTTDRSIPDPISLYALLRALGAVAAQPGDSLARVDRVTQAIADPVSSQLRDDPRAVNALRKLLQGVIYLVVNVPFGLHRSDQRIFAAVLSPRIRLPACRKKALSDDVEDACPVTFIRGEHSAGLSRKRASALSARWRSEWATYADVTRRLQAQDVFTWNQYLLHGCQHPQPLGLLWNGHHEGDHPDHYISITNDEAQLLRVPPMERIFSGTALSALESDECPWPDDCSPPLDRPEVLRRWELMRPLANIDLPSTASSAIYHLLRSYAIWGGEGFVSIPTQLAVSRDETATAVLSICSSPILGPEQILTWQLLAGYVFHPVFAGDLLSRYKMQSLVYELGHPVKHRAQRVASLAVYTRRIISAIADAEGQSGSSSSAELRRAADLITMVERYAAAARAYGEMANLFAACISSGGWEGLLTKSDWYTEEPFSILDPLRAAFALASNKDDARIVPSPTFISTLGYCFIVPWLSSEGRNVAPAALVYQHVFSELADNVANHGHCAQGAFVAPADVLVEELRDDLTAIVIRNAVPRDPENSADHGPTHVSAHFTEVRSGQATGASLAARVLRDLGIGLLERRFLPMEPADVSIVGHWEVRVILHGLRKELAGDESY